MPSLTSRGLSVDVIDPRTLVPLDVETIIASVQRTGRLVVADPAHRTCSAAAEISAIVAEEAFESLRAPIVRVTTRIPKYRSAPRWRSSFTPVGRTSATPSTECSESWCRSPLTRPRLMRSSPLSPPASESLRRFHIHH